MVPVGADAVPESAGILASTRRRYLRIRSNKRPTGTAMNLSRSVAELQREHVVFELECLDRMYLNAYVPQLTSENGVAWFFRGHLGHRFASTKEASPMTDRFVAAIGQFQLDHD